MRPSRFGGSSRSGTCRCGRPLGARLYRKINTFEIKHYLVKHFGRISLNQLGPFEIQVWLNNQATQYSQSVVRHCYINIRSILQMAKKLKFLTSDPTEDMTMPQTKAGDDPGADPEADRQHSRPARSVSDVRRHLLWSTRKRSSRLAVEVLDGNDARSPRNGIRRALLSRAAQEPF